MNIKTFPGKISQLRDCLCPACGREYYAAGIKAHILSQGRKEALAVYMGEKVKTKHADFVKANVIKRVVTETNLLDITFNQ